MNKLLSWKIFKPDILKTLDTLHKNQWLPYQTLREQQNDAFVKLIEHCRENVPYYRNLQGIDQVNSLSDIAKLPFLTKSIIKDNFESLKSQNFPKSRFIHMTTGGSTGESLVF